VDCEQQFVLQTSVKTIINEQKKRIYSKEKIKSVSRQIRTSDYQECIAAALTD